MSRLSGYLSIFIFTLFTISAVNGQNLSINGRFPTKYFSIKDYGSAAQIWSGIQNEDGLYIFGNRQDILCFNGNEWSKIKVDKDKTSKEDQTRSYGSYVTQFFKGSDKKIYVGRENNFGYLSYSSKGELVYFPLKTSDELNGFGKVWNIFEINNGEILFVAEKGIFQYKNGKVSSYTIPTSFKGMLSKTVCRVDKGMLLVFQSDDDVEFRKYKYLYIDILTGKAKETVGPDEESALNIRGSFELNGNWYVLNLSKSLYKVNYANGQLNWTLTDPNFFSFIQNYSPSSISRIDDQIYYCTENGGLIISDLNGRVKRVFDFNDNLENIFVNAFFIDQDKNIWLCLDNGIQFIETSSPLTFYKKKEGVTSQIEAIDFIDQTALVGLHTDIFVMRRPAYHDFIEPVNVFGQLIFDLETVEYKGKKRTVVIGYDGLYEYFPQTKIHEKIAPVYAFSFCKDPNNKQRLFIALEAGLGQLELINGNWVYTTLVADAGGETISCTYNNGKVYFSIRNKGIGIYNLTTKKFKILAVKNVDKDNNNYFVQTFQGTVYVGTGNGIFYIPKNEKSIVPFSKNDEFFGKGHKNSIHRLININDQQLWVVIYREFSDDRFEFETGWLDNKHSSWTYTKWPFAGLKDAGIISAIQRSPNGEIWLGANEGLFIFNPEMVRRQSSNLSVYIDKIDILGKTKVYNVNKSKKLESLDYKENSFKITFHTNYYSSQGPTLYRYKLEGFNDDWSDWSNLNFASFEKIGEGNYTLKIQAKNFYGKESSIFSYEITVLPPWYRTVWAYILYVIALLFIIYGVVLLSTQRVKRQNLRLEEIVQERTKEIAEQNHQLEIQKEEITLKTMDILDSIHYAKRIQTTILPTEMRLNEMFDDHFVFYRPKDIVSGDFYWAREVQGKMIFASVDCTGHGVPGALVSIVGNNGLLRAVNEFKLIEPNEILDKLREIVVNAFLSDGNADVKDGMDIALCSIDYETGILKYSGANNECVIIRNGEVIELKPDKQPIGSFIYAKPFTVQEFKLEPGDSIYLYTDGYVDQFGGEKLKKFKSKSFRTMLSEIAHQSMSDQMQIIQSTFDNWKIGVDQVDDVCVFGVKYHEKK